MICYYTCLLALVLWLAGSFSSSVSCWILVRELCTLSIVSAIIFYNSQEKHLVSKLCGPLRTRYLDRNGGYTRLLRIPNRRGDNAPMAVIELVDNQLPPLIRQ